MMITIDPHRFVDAPLIARSIAPDDYSVLVDGMRAGRIMRQSRSFGREVWQWSVTGPAMVQVPLASSGEDETLAAARLAFREAFDKWLTWAVKAPAPIYWAE